MEERRRTINKHHTAQRARERARAGAAQSARVRGQLSRAVGCDEFAHYSTNTRSDISPESQPERKFSRARGNKRIEMFHGVKVMV